MPVYWTLFSVSECQHFLFESVILYAQPLMESNKSLGETVGKVAVHCLYYRSGCQWQGTLTDCITHCTGCSFGNSPVVCNRCGTQIVHRQVQEHAQICPVSHKKKKLR